MWRDYYINMYLFEIKYTEIQQKLYKWWYTEFEQFVRNNNESRRI